MAIWSEARQRLRQVVGPLTGAVVIAYFAYHAVQGDRGLLAWMQLRQELARAQSEQRSVAEERAELEHRVALLRSEGIDPDLLEERARALLGFGYPGERVILPSPDAAR